MLNLNISADNIHELKQKVALSLGMMGGDGRLNFEEADSGEIEGDESEADGTEGSITPVGSAPLAMLSTRNQKAAGAKRARRSKAEMEADRIAANLNASPAEIIENNQKHGDAMDSAMAHVEAQQAEDEGSVTPTTQTEPLTTQDCRAALKSVIESNKPGAGVDAAGVILGEFKLGKVGDCPPEKMAAFIAACNAKLV